MQSITVSEKHADMKIEKYLQTIFPKLSYGTLQKALRKRDIKVNGTRVGRGYVVTPGDRLEVYITDDLLYGTANSRRTYPEDKFSIVYEDENILIVNKAPGVPVHPDKEQNSDTLIDLVREYLRTKDNCQPALCHRLDRNTGGLIIIAKNQSSRNIILEKLKSGEIKKYYQCLVKGKMDKVEEYLRAYLWKDSAKSRVFIIDHKKPGAHEIITAYKVLEYDRERDISRLEVELVTGRTHQIRAHLAHIGHPIIGDGKYGSSAINRSLGRKKQALWACRLKFDFAKDNALSKGNSLLAYLNGKEFSVEPEF